MSMTFFFLGFTVAEENYLEFLEGNPLAQCRRLHPNRRLVTTQDGAPSRHAGRGHEKKKDFDSTRDNPSASHFD